MNDKELESKAFELVSQVSSDNVQRALNAYTKAGGRSLAGATYVALGGAIGALSVAATILAPKDKMPTQDTWMFAALLLAACCQVSGKPLPKKGDEVAGTEMAIQTDWSPEQYMEAVVMFEKLTGRQPDGAVLDSMLSAAREATSEGTATADRLLNAICANHKPA